MTFASEQNDMRHEPRRRDPSHPCPSAYRLCCMSMAAPVAPAAAECPLKMLHIRSSAMRVHQTAAPQRRKASQINDRKRR